MLRHGLSSLLPKKEGNVYFWILTDTIAQGLATFRKPHRTCLVAVVMKRMRTGEVKPWPRIERPLEEQEATALSNYRFHGSMQTRLTYDLIERVTYPALEAFLNLIHVKLNWQAFKIQTKVMTKCEWLNSQEVRPNNAVRFKPDKIWFGRIRSLSCLVY